MDFNDLHEFNLVHTFDILSYLCQPEEPRVRLGKWLYKFLRPVGNTLILQNQGRRLCKIPFH